jgi:hypothetical protein
LAAAPSAPAAPAAASDGAPAVATTPFSTSGYAAQMVNTVAVTFTPQAKEKVSADRRFREGALLTAVEGELRARNLLKDGGSRAGRTVEIQIDDFATRASTNAVVLGYKLGAGTLTGNVRVRDGKGNELQGFRIEAASRLTTAVNDEKSNPLVSLFGRFAELTVDNLGGSPRKHDKAPANQMP